jgi:hypothetical protein
MEGITFQMVIKVKNTEDRCCCQNKDNCDSLLGFFFVDINERLTATGTASIENNADSS